MSNTVLTQELHCNDFCRLYLIDVIVHRHVHPKLSRWLLTRRKAETMLSDSMLNIIFCKEQKNEFLTSLFYLLQKNEFTVPSAPLTLFRGGEFR